MRAWTLYGLLALVVIAADQWIKLLVETRLPMQQMVELLPFLALYRTYNTGMAFSMLAGMSDSVLIVIVAIVIAFVLWLAAKSEPHQVWARAGFALIIGGAVGNLIDRAVHGHVIDYMLFHTPAWSFAVFNLADACITVGALLIIVQEIADRRRPRRGIDPAPGSSQDRSDS